MESLNNIQEILYSDMQNQALFEKAHQYGIEYLRHAFERNVYPNPEALQKLATFDEDMPSEPTNATQIIDLLQQFGAPATSL